MNRNAPYLRYLPSAQNSGQVRDRANREQSLTCTCPLCSTTKSGQFGFKVFIYACIPPNSVSCRKLRNQPKGVPGTNQKRWLKRSVNCEILPLSLVLKPYLRGAKVGYIYNGHPPPPERHCFVWHLRTCQ